MIDFRILTEWEDPKRAKGEELRATWASLRVQLETNDFSKAVTWLYDKDFNTVRHQVFGPMYPLAEWMALHWFQMLHGTERSSERDQDIRFGAEGFALPRLRICSEGDHVRLRWVPYIHHGANVEFLGEGDFTLPRAQVESELYSFLNRVVARLEEHQISGTTLQTEWQGILELDREERDFCIAVASLGLDPFDLPEGMEERIQGVAGLLSSEVMEDFFPAATSESVLEEAEAVSAVIRHLQGLQKPNTQLEKVRQSMQMLEPGINPWVMGYEAARKTRTLLGVNAGPISLDLLTELGDAAPVDELASVKRVDGIVMRNGTSSAAAVQPDSFTKRKDNLKFSLARLLCERLMLQASATGLITREKTTRQKVNRAFAAELLAPAAELQKRLAHSEVSHEDIQDLADEFDVSSFVIEKQIQNHRLAMIID